MILCINTTQGHNIEIAIKNGDKILAKSKFSAKYRQAERLLPRIQKMLEKSKFKLKDIEKIEVVNKGEAETSFTALRIGVVTANALGYALGVPVVGHQESLQFGGQARIKNQEHKFDIVKPIYSKEPNITKKIADNR